MGHSIRAVIGRGEVVGALARDWILAKVTPLPQDMAMVLATDADRLNSLTSPRGRLYQHDRLRSRQLDDSPIERALRWAPRPDTCEILWLKPEGKFGRSYFSTLESRSGKSGMRASSMVSVRGGE
jgi:hypothetical protein